MASRIVEFFGYAPADASDAARQAREGKRRPFLGCVCLKTLSDGAVSGVCTLEPARGGTVVCCPYRLYANDYACLRDVARIAFGPDCDLRPGQDAAAAPHSPGRVRVAVFGKRWGKELRLPNRGRSGGYFVDWVLARLGEGGELAEFVAVEVQSIDTTGNYQAERQAYLNDQPAPYLMSTAGFNWENVNKRILPQLIHKGHVLRRERLCRKGLFFICPTPVCTKIRERLGGRLLQYEMQSGALTLMWYNIGTAVAEGEIRSLNHEGQFTTTVDQVALAFTSPSNLPDANVYEQAINAELAV
jgi:hypothetical protein